MGAKWAANKWIYTHGNEFRRQCLPSGVVVEDNEEDIYKSFL
jgi:hypothetical protein